MTTITSEAIQAAYGYLGTGNLSDGRRKAAALLYEAARFGIDAAHRIDRPASRAGRVSATGAAAGDGERVNGG